MVWTITILTFLASLIIVGAVFYALSPTEAGVAGRLSRLFHTAAPPKEEKFSTKQKERMQNTLAAIGKLGASSKAKSPKSELMMIRAGYRSPEAMMAVRGFKLLVPVGLLALVFFTGAYMWGRFLFLGVA